MKLNDKNIACFTVCLSPMDKEGYLVLCALEHYDNKILSRYTHERDIKLYLLVMQVV